MARPQKPWYRKQTGWWMVEVGDKQVKLIQGPKDEEHRRLAEEKMVELRKLKRLAPQAVNSRTADVVDAYLSWSLGNLAEDTHRINRYYLQLFAEHCGQVPARDIKPYHVTAWIAEMQSEKRVKEERARWEAMRAEVRLKQATGEIKKEAKGSLARLGSGPRAWGETSVYNARKIAFRVFNWAKKEGILTENPLEGMERPKPAPRQRAMSEDEFRKMHANAGSSFRDFLNALYLTGARPKELRDLTWSQVKEDRLILVKHKTAKKVYKPRVIFLGEEAKAVIERLRGNGSDHVFLNTEGQPWSMNAVRLQISRLRKKLGLAPDLVSYLCRHGFGTRAIMSGVNPAVVAELMGHNSLDMVSKVYVHLAEQHTHLSEAMGKINASSTPVPDGQDQGRKRARPVNPKRLGRKKKG
jgi:integrase